MTDYHRLMSLLDSSSSDSEHEIRPIVPLHGDMMIHARLQHLALSGRSRYTQPGEGGWQRRKRRDKPERKYTEAQLNRFSRIYMDQLMAVTGIEMHSFKLTHSTQKYVSMFEFTRARDRVLATLFERQPTCWDLTAGSGGDAMGFLGNLDPKEVVACQRSVPDGQKVDSAQFADSKREYDIMCSNIKEFVRAAGIDAKISVEGEESFDTGTRHRVHIKCKHKLAQTFLMSVKKDTEVDIVYLDPSWDDARDSGEQNEFAREMNPHELFSNLNQLIWEPIRQQRIKVGCYVIKTRWNLLDVETYLKAVNSQFIATYSVRAKPFRPNLDDIKPDTYSGSKGAYYYMILTHREYKTIDVHQSQMYWDIVRNGRPVWVKRDTCVKLIKPVYSNHRQFPVWTEKDPHNEAYMKIEPHSRLKPGDTPIEGPHDPEETTTYDPRKYHTGEEPGGPERSDSSEDEDNGPFSSTNPYDALGDQ
jgi:hypothetical protein